MIYGYVFAESIQEEEQQRYVLSGLSVLNENIYIDRFYKNGDDHQMLERMEHKLQTGDLVYVKNLDWLGYNYEEILEQWRTLTKKLKADVVVLDMPLVDTRRGKEFMETLVSEVVMEMLAFSQEHDYRKNQKRSSEAYRTAKARGVHYGRPIKPLPDNFVNVYERWKAGEITGCAAAEECGMPLSTFRWRASRYEDEQNKEQAREIKKENIA